MSNMTTEAAEASPMLPRWKRWSRMNLAGTSLASPGPPRVKGRRERGLLDAVEDEACAKTGAEQHGQGAVEVVLRHRLPDHGNPLAGGRAQVVEHPHRGHVGSPSVRDHLLGRAVVAHLDLDAVERYLGHVVLPGCGRC